MLLECEDPAYIEKIYALAMDIKKKNYGNRIVMFAPSTSPTTAVNECRYCPYHHHNKHIARKQLSQEDIVREVVALQDMGHKRLALETGEDPVNCRSNTCSRASGRSTASSTKTARSAA